MTTEKRTEKKAVEKRSRSTSPMEAFHTRSIANEGKKVFLKLPDGTETEEYLIVLGGDSDTFRKKEAEFRRKIATDIQEGKETDASSIDRRIELLAPLVIGWSFETSCNFENVSAFLREAPQIADQIDRLAYVRKDFFDLPSAG